MVAITRPQLTQSSKEDIEISVVNIDVGKVHVLAKPTVRVEKKTRSEDWTKLKIIQRCIIFTYASNLEGGDVTCTS
eukprot:c35599_g1_i1 orf=17-244(-)